MFSGTRRAALRIACAAFPMPARQVRTRARGEIHARVSDALQSDLKRATLCVRSSMYWESGCVFFLFDVVLSHTIWLRRVAVVFGARIVREASMSISA